MDVIRRISLSEQVVNSIIQYIQDNNLRVGDKLPTEEALSESFRVSRTSVREALKALSINGALESIPGRGTFLCAPIANFIMNKNGVLVMEAYVTISEIMEVRTAMELLALDLAISRGTDEEIELVQTAMDDLRASVLSGKPWATAGTSFHTRIAEMSGNVLLLKFVDSLAYSIGKYKDFLIEANTSMDRHIADHQAILDALRNRDREAGEIAVRRHMISTEEDIKRLVNENSATHFVIR